MPSSISVIWYLSLFPPPKQKKKTRTTTKQEGEESACALYIHLKHLYEAPATRSVVTAMRRSRQRKRNNLVSSSLLRCSNVRSVDFASEQQTAPALLPMRGER